MKFEWDESKSSDCFRVRGFYFQLATRVFADPQRKVNLDNRFFYGEDRYIALGKAEGRVLHIVSPCEMMPFELFQLGKLIHER